jgi:hypothetical protein
MKESKNELHVDAVVCVEDAENCQEGSSQLKLKSNLEWGWEVGFGIEKKRHEKWKQNVIKLN